MLHFFQPFVVREQSQVFAFLLPEDRGAELILELLQILLESLDLRVLWVLLLDEANDPAHLAVDHSDLHLVLVLVCEQLGFLVSLSEYSLLSLVAREPS